MLVKLKTVPLARCHLENQSHILGWVASPPSESGYKALSRVERGIVSKGASFTRVVIAVFIVGDVINVLHALWRGLKRDLGTRVPVKWDDKAFGTLRAGHAIPRHRVVFAGPTSPALFVCLFLEKQVNCCVRLFQAEHGKQSGPRPLPPPSGAEEGQKGVCASCKMVAMALAAEPTAKTETPAWVSPRTRMFRPLFTLWVFHIHSWPSHSIL